MLLMLMLLMLLMLLLLGGAQLGELHAKLRRKIVRTLCARC
jgi:hypothetical protein